MFLWLSCSYNTFRKICNSIKANRFLSCITIIFFRTLNCHYNVTDLLHHFVVSYEVRGYETCIETQFLSTVNFSWLLNSVNITLSTVIDWLLGRYLKMNRNKQEENWGDKIVHNIKIIMCLEGPPLWSSGQSSWLQIQRSGFDFLRYQIFWEVVGLERGPLSLVSTAEELLERESSSSGLESREYGRRDPSRWPRGTLHPKKLAPTSPTSGGRSVGIFLWRTQATEFFLYALKCGWCTVVVLLVLAILNLEDL
jgi:hypothetical protein